MVPKNIIAAQIVRSITASVSFSSSSFLCFTIWRSRNRLGSPYSRIIFGLSIADIFQSSGFILGQVLSPADTPDAIFSRGTVTSCEVIGYIFIVGSAAILWYTLFLTYYFLRRVKYKKTKKDFAQQEEYYIFLFIWIYPFVVAVTALKLEQINATRYGSTCYITPDPWNCLNNEEIECTRGENGSEVLVWIGGGTILFVFLCLVAVLVSFTCYIYNAEKHLQGNDLTKQATKQSILYILAFMIVYIGPLIIIFSRFSGSNVPETNFWLTSIFYPIGGFLNMLIYTRPKIQTLKKVEPQLPIIVCFMSVILAGGEVPSLVDYDLSIQRYADESRLARWAHRLGWTTNSANLDQAMDNYVKELYQKDAQDENTPRGGSKKNSSKRVKFDDEVKDISLSEPEMSSIYFP